MKGLATGSRAGAAGDTRSLVGVASAAGRGTQGAKVGDQPVTIDREGVPSPERSDRPGSIGTGSDSINDAMAQAGITVKTIAEGRSLLLVEQYVERAVGIADYVYILQKGEIVFVGEPSQCASGVVFARYLGASA